MRFKVTQNKRIANNGVAIHGSNLKTNSRSN